MKSTYMCFLKDFKENRPRLALILRLTAIQIITCVHDLFRLVRINSGRVGDFCFDWSELTVAAWETKSCAKKTPIETMTRAELE